MSNKMSDYRRALYEVITPAMGGVVVVLNILEIIFIAKGWKNTRKTLAVVYIMNLAISDVVVGMVMVVLKSMDPFMKTDLKNDVIAKEFYDVIRYLFIRLSLFVSVFNLIALTLDRVWAITNPFSHRKRTTRFAWKVCAGVWILSIVCSTGIYSMSRFHLQNIGRYNNLVFPISTYTATIIFVISYVKIYRALKESRKELKFSERNAEKEAAGDKRNVYNATEVKFLKLALKTVSIFVICWTPFSTISLIMALGLSSGGKEVEFTLFTLAFFNSVMNPFVYFQHAWKALAIRWNKFRKRINSRRSIPKTQTSE